MTAALLIIYATSEYKHALEREKEFLPGNGFGSALLGKEN